MLGMGHSAMKQTQMSEYCRPVHLEFFDEAVM